MYSAIDCCYGRFILVFVYVVLYVIIVFNARNMCVCNARCLSSIGVLPAGAKDLLSHRYIIDRIGKDPSSIRRCRRSDVCRHAYTLHH